MVFKTQVEIWQALLDGKKIVSASREKFFQGDYLAIHEGSVFGFHADGKLAFKENYSFHYPREWKIYEPQPKILLKEACMLDCYKMAIQSQLPWEELFIVSKDGREYNIDGHSYLISSRDYAMRYHETAVTLDDYRLEHRPK